MKKIYKIKLNDYKELLWQLQECAVYLVEVTHNENNPEHKAILFMWFKNGAYCEIYSNNYERPYNLSEIYTIKIIKKLLNDL